ncbi:MAG: DEAD/DEAH box helicase [Deltaproteobacteria bacterium]|nr:DEAD/DEAH box helicase [Deltaproteobacteria bacterium]
MPDNPLIVQSDHTLLLEVQAPRATEARDALLAFAELIKSPEYVHTWRLTPLSLWNAAAAGHDADEVCGTLTSFAKYPVPEVVRTTVRHHMGRYGALRLVQDGAWLRLEADLATDLTEVTTLKDADGLFGAVLGPTAVQVHPRRRGELKQILVAAGHPVQDLVGYEDGDALSMALQTADAEGAAWSLRDYQVQAVDSFTSGPTGGSGVVVLPCGAGKTLVGIAAMVRLGMRTLILCTGHTALQQWKREILARTTLTEDDVGEYSSRVKELRPVTLTTYQLLTWRENKGAAPAHFRLFYEANWGLIVYDEVHLLPAPIFREAAYLQARRRLGLTATLVREDGREGDVFALVGPKRYDLPWKELERQGWIATARCVEVRVPLSDADRIKYVQAGGRQKFAIAAKNPRKVPVIDTLLERHEGEPILILGTYVEQLRWIARRLGIEVVTGTTKHAERDDIFGRFRDGSISVLALSKVGNFAIDLPGASVAIQIAGTWGSRQEEAQRLGRVLRPKDGSNQALFYTLVTSESREQEVAEWRQLFLAEQGYPYRVELIS